jgi:hypothetical protein
MNAFEMTRAKRQSRRKTEVAILNANNSDFARSEVILVDLQTKITSYLCEIKEHVYWIDEKRIETYQGKSRAQQAERTTTIYEDAAEMAFLG